MSCTTLEVSFYQAPASFHSTFGHITHSGAGGQEMVLEWKNLAAISINSSSRITFSVTVKAAAFFFLMIWLLWADRECF